MTDTLTTPVVTVLPSDPELEDDDPIFSHIVGPKYTDEGKVTGAELVMQARVFGTPVTALCGYVWVPSRNPENHPVCDRCLAIANRKPE